MSLYHDHETQFFEVGRNCLVVGNVDLNIFVLACTIRPSSFSVLQLAFIRLALPNYMDKVTINGFKCSL